MPIKYTINMRKRLTQRLAFMLQTGLREFPELQGKTITIGYTRAYLGSAIPETMTIRLRARKVSYNTIGHELTHLVQGMTNIPEGEKQCDIWTLARSKLFCDEAPTYLKIPSEMRNNWSVFALEVHRLCIQAIEVRKSYRNYIQWLEKELGELAWERPQKNEQTILELF